VNQPTLEFSTVAVGSDLRIKIPKSLLPLASWITGDQPVSAWLLVGSPGRCRLLSATEVDANPNLSSLRDRIATELNTPSNNALEFRDKTSVALAVRLVPVRITPPDPGWRLALPGLIAAIMQIRPGESEIAALFVHGHIELWTIETLRAAVTTPLTEII
jgi:hypothetical protein